MCVGPTTALGIIREILKASPGSPPKELGAVKEDADVRKGSKERSRPEGAVGGSEKMGWWERCE